MRQLLRQVLSNSVFLYPLLMHVLIERGMIAAALIGLAVVSLIACAPFVFERRGGFRAALFGFIALAALAGLAGGQAFALYLPPVIFNLVLALVFGRTLRTGAVPLIERFMRFYHGDSMSPALVRYAHHLTWLWVILFLVMALVATWLATFASLQAWSLFANVISYLLVLGLFLGQFVYGYARYRTPLLRDIIPTALRIARRAASNASIGR